MIGVDKCHGSLKIELCVKTRRSRAAGLDRYWYTHCHYAVFQDGYVHHTDGPISMHRRVGDFPDLDAEQIAIHGKPFACDLQFVDLSAVQDDYAGMSVPEILGRMFGS